MKNLLSLFAALLVAVSGLAQGFTFQAVVRDSENKLVANETISSIDVVISKGSEQIYTENFSNVETNMNGLFQIEIGSGNPTAFAAIDWDNSDGNKQFFIEITTPYGTSTQQLMSVPFAKYAEVAKAAVNSTKVGDMPMAKVTIKVVDATGKGSVKFLGKSLTAGSYSYTIPAYSPTFLSVALSAPYVTETTSNITKYSYTVKINGKNFDNYIGESEKVLRIDRGDAPKLEINNRTHYQYDYYAVMDNAKDTEYGTLGRGYNTYGIENAQPDMFVNYTQYEWNYYDLITLSDKNKYTLNFGSQNHHEYENPVYIRINSSDKKGSYENAWTPVFMHNPFAAGGSPTNLNDVAYPLFVKIPNYKYTPVKEVKKLCKVGTEEININADMVNQVVGPFELEENVIEITITKEVTNKVN
ncbi:MAG: hypothetical protein HUJ96_01355 [Marinilabiliaceae bacterium]|nr:hypothetical protein [Marinilabiliaceae bacterium]